MKPTEKLKKISPISHHSDSMCCSHAPSTASLNAVIAAHIRNNRLPAAIAAFTASPPALRDTTSHNLLLSIYTSTQHLHRALHLFDEMPHRDAVSYNTLLSALARSSLPLPALRLFRRMLRSGVGPTGPTLSTLLPSLPPDPNLAPQLHVIAVRSALTPSPFVGSALITAYTNLKDATAVKRAFSEIQIKNSVTWTSLITGLMDLNRVTEARQAFDTMPCRNNTAAAYTALISGYIKNGDIISARRAFDDLTAEKNVVTWTAMINGYNKIGRFREALKLFVEMNRVSLPPVSPNPFTCSAALTAAAGLASLAAGESVHARVVRGGWRRDHVLATCLVEMYGRCGDADAAVWAFEETRPETRNAATWNAVIGSCGKNGRSDKAVEYFYRILTEGHGTRPDSVTFVNILTACAHGGLVREGEGFFERMVSDFGIERRIEHYGCLIDLYARAGMAEEAERVVAAMPVAADAAALGAGMGVGFERRIRVCGERGEWGRMGELKEERERRVGKKKGRGVSMVESNFG